MIAPLFNNSPIPVLEQLVNFTQSRHQVLAGNIANLDTPGYRTRDLSPDEFQGRLRAAIEERERHRVARQGDAAQTGYSTSGLESGDPVARVSEGLSGILRHDDSNAGFESQVMELTRNHLQHNLALTILTSQFRTLATAISERV